MTSMSEDVRPLCIFCHQRFSLAAGAETPCPDPRTSWGHVEFWASTKEQRDARFGPVASRDDEQVRQEMTAAYRMAPPEKPVEAKPLPPQMGFGL